MSEVDLESFAWGILNEFNHISKERFHTIAFLCEHEYYNRHSEQITDTTYREYLSGVYNEDLTEVLLEQHRLDIEDITYGGEEITRITIPVTQVVTLPDEVEEVISQVVQEYGTIDDAEEVAKSLIPREVSLLSPLDFEDVYDSVPSMAERLHGK